MSRWFQINRFGKDRIMARIYKIQRLDIIDLLIAIGYKSCVKWDATRLTEKVNELADLIAETNIPKDALGKKNTQVLKQICSTLNKGNKFRVIYENDDATPTSVKKKVAEKQKSDTRPPNPKGKGVLATIIEKIKNDGPVTRTQILDHLCKEFPDRVRKSMNTTLINQLSYGLRKRGVLLDRDWSGDKVAYTLASGKKKAKNTPTKRPAKTTPKKKATAAPKKTTPKKKATAAPKATAHRRKARKIT
jgi:hypothetical protein